MLGGKILMGPIKVIVRPHCKRWFLCLDFDYLFVLLIELGKYSECLPKFNIVFTNSPNMPTVQSVPFFGNQDSRFPPFPDCALSWAFYAWRQVVWGLIANPSMADIWSWAHTPHCSIYHSIYHTAAGHVYTEMIQPCLQRQIPILFTLLSLCIRLLFQILILES